MNMRIKRIGVYVLGLLVLGLGISLVIRAGLGSGAWDALYVGLNEQFGLSVGTWLIIVGILLIFINAYLLRERPDWSVLITLFVLGQAVDLWLYIINWKPVLFGGQMGLLIVGLLVLSLGVAIYLQAKLAPTAIDKLMYGIAHRTGLSLRLSKTSGEVVALILAWIAGGPIGIGTVLITFLVGPCVQFFMRWIESPFMSFLSPSEVCHNEG
ncbi:YitT family protein [Hazenella sp. IB182357]|uniref:YitT family protein n=2 Tax=Polycladospora coralii TaxID=2771432 RepID=A0A926NAB8_9BACL|nr:YitT family protein [Polycladospora coralii]MBS7529529.1 YitT family protein [Polycladospora coralii]